jgi:hypothetical protein
MFETVQYLQKNCSNVKPFFPGHFAEISSVFGARGLACENIVVLLNIHRAVGATGLELY